ncbi:UPF0052 domain protein [Polychaeton citri CBS 116435]|uniref:UPF0052 domain protein n=1 Tax=Polychaeton citri CBS 116435 TaxID=1314669 RepID=A0A9P4QDK2_9PEZI|nr:UPF0052 domain protein [Polychaeton citri CBS 116435]
MSLEIPGTDIATPWRPSRPQLDRTLTPRTRSFQDKHSGLVVFSGGSAANSLVDVFEHVRAANQTTLSYIIPISDNGGSSSELIRVFGGPGIGDVRSRLVRLIPDDSDEAAAIKQFFNHRLSKDYAPAKIEWLDIVEATHPLWHGISSPKRELIRSYLNMINLEMVKRMRPSSRFDFSGASVGNLFLTGARLFTGSFEAAIYLLSSICAVPDRIQVLPVLNSNFAHHIAVRLEDGTVITGQNNISHPSVPSAAVPAGNLTDNNTLEMPLSPTQLLKTETEEHDRVEDANLPGTLPILRKPAIAFSKEDEEDLPSRIERLWYINPYGQEIRIPANPRVLDALSTSAAIVYCIGSLFTSLIPSLVLPGVGEAIASSTIRSKILILNGSIDRETGPLSQPFTAMDFVAAIANACADSRNLPPPGKETYAVYVSHILYLNGPGTPKMEKEEFSKIGIDTIRLYGPRDENGGAKKGGRYDAIALTQALDAIIGRKKDPRLDRSRRNTLVG